MPRKDESSPRKMPMVIQEIRRVTCRVRILSFFNVQTIVSAVIISRQRDCSAPTLSILEEREETAANSHFPISPPAAAPSARGKVFFLSICEMRVLLFITEYVLMDSTVQPDKKLITETSII